MLKFAWPLLSCLGYFAGAAATMFHVNPPNLPDGVAGKAYTGGPLLLQGGGECPRNIPVVHMVAGALPGGMYLTAGGQFGGMPLEPGRYEFVVRVENGCGWSDQAMSLQVVGAPLLLANPASLEFRIAQGQSVAPASIQVSGNAAGAAYTVESSAGWAVARPRAGRIPGSGAAVNSDLVDVEIASAALPPGQHRASIVIGGWRTAQPVVVPVRVDVLGPAPLHTQETGRGGEVDPMFPRIALAAPAVGAAAVLPANTAAAVHGQQPSPDAHAAGPPYASAPSPARTAKAGRPPSAPGRLSRPAQLRSKYLASKAASPAPAPGPASAPAAAADPHAKPSAMGEPVKKAAADTHGKPAAEALGKPPAAAPGKPAADAHGKPAAAAHAKPAEKPKATAKH